MKFASINLASAKNGNLIDSPAKISSIVMDVRFHP